MDYYDALRLRAPMLQNFVQNTLNGADAFLIPTIPGVAPLVKDTVGTDETKLEREFSALSFWTRGTNYLGVPALSVPAGMGVRDLPLGVQFLGAPFAEDRLLAIGHIFQQHSTWHLRER
jgi:aspartyl-tRNA(Asn)/glutamyl-tRNA(Gln) amidotransferase subunit A